MSHQSNPISLIVIARNEAENIKRCLDSVTCCSEKIVIDSGSDDGTRSIAISCGARVIEHSWLGFGPQRNFGTKQSNTDWILVLDADETLTPAGNDEITRIISQSPEANSFRLPRAAMFMGKSMRWYRPMVGEKLIRLYNKLHCEWTNDLVHEKIVTKSKVGTLSQVFMHHHSPTTVHKHLKFIQYAELGALEKHRAQKSSLVGLIPFIYTYTFLKDFVWRLGIGDGWRGFAVAHVAGVYACYKRLRLYEMNVNPASIPLAKKKLSQTLGWQNTDEK